MNIVKFPRQASVFQPVGQYIRLGENAYRKVADLAATGDIASKRFVVDASKIKHLSGIIQLLQGHDAEIVLDAKVLELSSRKKCGGTAAGVPWASEQTDEPLPPGILTAEHPSDIFGAIARCAVKHGVSAVLSPSHYLSDPAFDGWYQIDLESCRHLRRALDQEGGARIAIDFLIAARLTDLCDHDFQARLMLELPNLPIENLWVRVSMKSPDTSPTNAKRLIGALARWHNIGVPIVMDYMGGLTGEALLAMNVVSATSHGIGEQASFDTSNWSKPPKKRESDGPNGRATRVGLTAFGRTFTSAELEVLLSASGAKSVLLPNDKNMLPNGIEDVMNNPRRFNAMEAQRRIKEIEDVPTVSRPDKFDDSRMSEVVETAKKAAKLNPKPEKATELNIDVNRLAKRLKDHRRTSEDIRATYETPALERTEQGTLARAIGVPRVNVDRTETGTE